MSIGRVIGGWVLLVAMPFTAWAGALDRFEEGVSGTARSERTRVSDSHGIGDELLEVFFQELVEGLFSGVVYGGFNSMALMLPESKATEGFGTRHVGDPVIPLLALEVNWQDIEGDVTAWDYRAEVGYAFLGFTWRKTFYREADSDLALNTAQLHGVYRMTFDDEFEIGMGFGSLELKGHERRTGFSFAMPMKLHTASGVGVEYRPVWSTIDETRLYDNDLAVVLGRRFGFVRLGYRWFYHRDESLSGFQLGAGVKW